MQAQYLDLSRSSPIAIIHVFLNMVHMVAVYCHHDGTTSFSDKLYMNPMYYCDYQTS